MGEAEGRYAASARLRAGEFAEDRFAASAGIDMLCCFGSPVGWGLPKVATLLRHLKNTY